MTYEVKGYFYERMVRDLLRSLGYDVVCERHLINVGGRQREFDALLKFESNIFLRPAFSPDGLTILECKSGRVSGPADGVNQISENIKFARESEEYRQRFGEISGGILVAESFGREAVEAAEKEGVYCWDTNRLFFYVMKIFAHSLLETWVSESRLGCVIREELASEQFKPEKYVTSRLIGFRYSEKSQQLELYFTYFVDCILNPLEVSRGINAISRDDVKIILADAIKKIKEFSQVYVDAPMKIIIEIHSLPGFTEDAEYHTKDYVPTFTDWKSLGITDIVMDEHTLFKYSVIPWEALMDYASTKRLQKYTVSYQGLSVIKSEIEEGYIDGFRKDIEQERITDPFYGKNWIIEPNRKIFNIPTSLIATSTDAPIKQILIIFRRTSLKNIKEDIEKIIGELKDYNYKWIGIVSATGFTDEEKKLGEKFEKTGVGLALIDAIKIKLVTNFKSHEGEKIRQIFLARAII